MKEMQLGSLVMESIFFARRFWRRLSRIIKPVVFGALTVSCQVHAGTDPTLFSLEELMSLTVVGGSKYDQQQSEIAAATSVITRNEIRAFGWRTLGQALASLPGIHATYDRQYRYLGARGFGMPGDYNTRVLIMINGNRVNDPVYDQGPVGLEFPLDLNLVDRIEFIAGPGGAIYGQNAMFGVVNVVTRKGADIQGGEVFVGWQTRQQASEGGVIYGRKLDNGIDMVLSATGLNSRGEDIQLDYGSAGVAGVAAGMDGAHVHRLFAQLGKGPWSFDLTHGKRRKNDPTGSYFSDPLVAGQYSGDQYTLANLQYQDSFRDGTLQLTGRVFAGSYRYTSRASYGTSVDMPAQGDWHGAEVRMLSSATPRHRILLGLEMQDNVRVNQQMLDIANPVNNVRIDNSGYRVGVYAQDEWGMAGNLTAILGLRVDANSESGTQTSPRAGLIWQAFSGTTVKALAGRAYRNPNAFERDYFDGTTQVANPSLGGESIDTLELLTDHRLDAQTMLRASVYQWQMENLIVLGMDSVSGLTQYRSGQNVGTKGMELSLDRTWPGGSRLRGSLSLQQTRYADGSAVLNSPARLFKLLVSMPMLSQGMNLAYELHAESPRLTLDGTRLGGYGVSNLYLRWDTLAKGWAFGLGISNLFDKRYAQPAADTNWQNALVQDGRSLRLQASYRF